MKWPSVIIYCITGIYTALCGLYVMAGYIAGLPSTQWSTALLVTVLSASAVVFIAGILAPLNARATTWAALIASSILALMFIIAISPY